MRVACARWGDAPFAHIVVAACVDVVRCPPGEVARDGRWSADEGVDDDGARDGNDRGRASERGDGDDAFISEEERWAWTGARDGGIVRWALDAGAARRAGGVGAASYCSGHDDTIVALVPTSRAIVSVDEAGVMCAWDRLTGKCLRKHAWNIEVRLVCESAIECGGSEAVAIIAAVESRGQLCKVIDPMGPKAFDLVLPPELDGVIKIFVDCGTLSVMDNNGHTHSWAKIHELSAMEKAMTPSVSTLDLTGWGNIPNPIIGHIGEVVEGADSFHHTLDTLVGRVQIHGNKTNCIVSLTDRSFALTDKWDSNPDVVVTSCAPAKGGVYAPESYVYGYSDGTICSKPLYGSSANPAEFHGHDGAVLSLLDWVGASNENCLISGGEDGTTRAWDYRESKNIAILRHHQGPVRWILPAPTSARDASWSNIFITVGDDGVLGFVSACTWAVNFIMPGNGFAVKEMVWNAPRGVLAVLSKDGSLHVWDVLTGVLERHLTGGAVSVMLSNLREGSFHVVLHGTVGLAQRQWKFMRKRPRPLAWRCMQPNIFALSVNIDTLLEPARSGLPSRGVKRSLTLDFSQSEVSPLAETFADEEVRALHLLLGFLLCANDDITTSVLDDFSMHKLRYSTVSFDRFDGAATFDLPGSRGSRSMTANRQSLLLMAAVVIRIIQVSDGLNVSSYYALIKSIERNVGKVGDIDFVYFAHHCVDQAECVRQASKRLLSASLENSLPSAFTLPAPECLTSCEQYAKWDLMASDSKFTKGLLGLIISSAVCFAPNNGAHSSWHVRVSRTLLDGLKSDDKKFLFTAASLLTEGIKRANWSACLTDPNKTLEEVFNVCSTSVTTSTNPTESMMNREALSDLLSAFALVSPPFFFSHMNERIRTLGPEHPAHVLAFTALTRVAQTHARTLQIHTAYLMETVMLALNPSNPSLRKSCQQSVYALLTELGKSSSMALHHETQRFAAAIHGAVKNGTVIVVYDLQTATKWRTLEDSHTDSSDRSVEAPSTDWTDPLGLLVSPEKHVKHSPNVLVDHTRSKSAGEYDSGELSVKAVSFDAEGNQVAAYLDKLSFVYVWDLTPSWRQAFTRGALPLGTSHYMPCVPSEAPLHNAQSGGSGNASIDCSLKFIKSRQLHLVHGEVDMVFSFV